MGFIIRSVFWLSLVLLLIPFGGTGKQETVNPMEALMAARGAIQDLSGLCARRPDVCETGKAAIHTISVRAQAGARIAYDALSDEAESPSGEGAVATGGDQIADIIATGTVAPVN
jgi:hypothetical protein